MKSSSCHAGYVVNDALNRLGVSSLQDDSSNCNVSNSRELHDVINNKHIPASVYFPHLTPIFFPLSCNLYHVFHVDDVRKKTADIYQWPGTQERSNQMSECK